MAEFQEVMRQLGRICSTNFGECDICDLHPFCPSKTFLDKYVKSGRTERLEEMVLSWAAEHPVVYPTWLEWLKSMGIIPYMMGLVTTRDEDGVFDDGHVRITESALKEIPADIAKKLGLEPKEG